MKLIYVLSLFFCIFLSLFLCISNELYSDRVKTYDSETFKQNIGNIPHFVNFFAPWCGYCKRLKPVWDELAEKYNVDPSVQKLVIAKVDCTTETPLCAEEHVSGYPSLMFYPAGLKIGQKYKGKRDLNGLEEFININLPKVERSKKIISSTDSIQSENGPLELTDETFHKTIDWGMHFVKFYAPWCGHCLKMAGAWQDLAESFQNDKSVTISQVDCTVHKMSCMEFEVKGFPTLLWIVNGKRVEKYHGARNVIGFKQYVADRKAAHKDAVESQEGKIPDSSDKAGDLVVELSAANFENAIAKDFSFVKFYQPWCGHSKRLTPIWNELAKKFVTNTNVKIAKVDCNQDEELCKTYKVVGYPTLQLFRNGEYVAEYTGPRKLEQLHSFLHDYLLHDEL